MKITEVDKNFIVDTNLDFSEFEFYSIPCEPFALYGVRYDEDCFVRMPRDVAQAISDKVDGLNYNCAGGRVRFKTASKKIAIIAKADKICVRSHITRLATIGFDLYCGECDNEQFLASYLPSLEIDKEGCSPIVGIKDTRVDGFETFTLNFPPYGGIRELFIGVLKGSEVLPPDPYRYDKPVVCYGSSITQGGCATRPGMTYQGIFSRIIGCDYVNLGFAGSARAEQEARDYIEGLDMSVFILDYDHNAPTLEHLERTHEPFFKQIRSAHPTLPIIILPRPRYELNEDDTQRYKVIRRTYDNAVADGDENVYFISGRELMSIAKNDWSVDGTHPNDLGFYSMGVKIAEVLKQIFNTEK